MEARNGELDGRVRAHNVASYAAGMGLLITALTVSLAVAKIGLLGVLRRGMHRVEQIAGGFVLLSGIYLAYYFLAFRTSINFCNNILIKIEKNGELKRSDKSIPIKGF